MISGVEDTRYIGILISRYLSWVLPLRCLGDMVHVVELPCGGLGHLPPGGEGAKIVDITNIERLLPKVLVLNSVILKHLLSSGQRQIVSGQFDIKQKLPGCRKMTSK